MCPDDALLSSYLDGEVPSPWKERIEFHAARCPECSRKLKAFGSLSSDLRSLETEGERRALEEARIRIGRKLGELSIEPRRSPGLGIAAWISAVARRRIVVPMPYLAAGILAIAFMAGITLGYLSPVARASRLLASASKTLPASQASYESIVQYMRQNASGAVLIEMPKSAAFSQMGNPVFISYGEPLIETVGSSGEGSGASR